MKATLVLGIVLAAMAAVAVVAVLGLGSMAHLLPHLPLR